MAGAARRRHADALPGEFGFANGGQCLTVSNNDAWIGTAGAATARVLHSRDRGLTWTVSDTPLVSGPTGASPVDPHRGVTVGGDVTNLASGAAASAITSTDGGVVGEVERRDLTDVVLACHSVA